METHKIIKVVIAGILILGFNQNANSQILKKLKEKMVQTAAEKANSLAKSKENTKVVKSEKETPKNETIKVPEKEAIVDYNDAIVFKSPDESFKDISLQSYKGLPRFGTCNFYMKTNTRPLMTPEANAKRDRYKNSYPAFENLLVLNFAREYFEVMDKEYLIPKLDPNFTEEQAMSLTAQKLLKTLAFLISSESVKQRYFCAENVPSRSCYAGREWGGYNSDEFTKNEKYAAYVKNHFEALKSWSEQFFKDGTETFYMVTTPKFNGNDYDFDQNGYWLQIPPRHRNFGLDYSQMHDQFFFEFSPITVYGNKLMNNVNDPRFAKAMALFKISPEKAEALVNKKPDKLYMVSKLKVVFKGKSNSNSHSFQPGFIYHFDSPIIEIFEDAALEEKIGEISLENLIFKEG